MLRLNMILFILVVLIPAKLSAEEQTIRLYDGAAPGSENWHQQEKSLHSDFLQSQLVYNVVTPTLTVFEPAPDKANGTGIIICPGGGFHFLSIDTEGFDVARALVAKGVTCFVLKYRTVECKTDDPFVELMQKMGSGADFPQLIEPTFKLAIADAFRAIKQIRTGGRLQNQRQSPRHHRLFRGRHDLRRGGLSLHTRDAAQLRCHDLPRVGEREGLEVPSDAPPLFILAATDDQLGLTR